MLGALLLSGALTAKSVFAAACCAGSGAAPSIISGDDVAQISLSGARGTIIGDAPAQGIPVFRNGTYSSTTNTYLLSGALLVSDLWQVGTSIPVITNDSGTQGQSTGLGDIRINGTYEILPEWTYSYWKPKGFLFMQFTSPTGHSIADSDTPAAVDSLGKGIFATGIGGFFVKRWSTWDVYTITEIHYGFSRTFQLSTGNSRTLGSGLGGSCSIGVGVSPGAGNFRIGLRIQPLYESPRINSDSGVPSQISYQLSWNTALEASYLIDTAWAINASYTDQTLLGPAVNTTLSRTFALGLQHRWTR